jgi:CBS domain-containing protein
MLEDLNLTAADVMTKDVVTVHPHTSIRYLAKLLANRHISGAPVVDDDGKLVGMVSEADLMRWRDGGAEKQAWWLTMIAEGAPLNPDYLDFVRAEQEKVRTVMSSDPVCVSCTTSVTEVARVITDRNIKRVAVIDNGRLVGVVSRSDLVRALALS